MMDLKGNKIVFQSSSHIQYKTLPKLLFFNDNNDNDDDDDDDDDDDNNNVLFSSCTCLHLILHSLYMV